MNSAACLSVQLLRIDIEGPAPASRAAQGVEQRQPAGEEGLQAGRSLGLDQQLGPIASGPPLHRRRYRAKEADATPWGSMGALRSLGSLGSWSPLRTRYARYPSGTWGTWGAFSTRSARYASDTWSARSIRSTKSNRCAWGGHGQGPRGLQGQA